MRRLAPAAVIAAAALALPVSSASAAPTGCANVYSAPATLSAPDRAEGVLCLLNVERTKAGLPVLRRDGKLEKAARAHSADMVAQHYFDHDSRNGASFVSRIRATGWMHGRDSWSVGENLGWGTGSLATPDAMVRAWMASEPHRETLLDAEYGSAGVGVRLGVPSADRDGDGATYTVNFGSLKK